LTKVDSLYSDYVISSYRRDAHRLWVSDKVMPSAKKASDLLLKSSDNLREIVREGASFTFFGPIFGAAPWTQGRYVHRFALPSNFWGFCGTIPDLSLLGMVYNGGQEFTPIVKPLEMMPTDIGWYEAVIRANMNRNAIFLRLGRQYSPISNVIVPPFKGVKFATRGTDLAYADQGDGDDFYDNGDDSEEGDVEFVPEEGEDEYVRSEDDEDFEDAEDDDEEEIGETTESDNTTTTLPPPPGILRSPPVSKVVKSVTFEPDASPQVEAPVASVSVSTSIRHGVMYQGSSSVSSTSVPSPPTSDEFVERRSVKKRTSPDSDSAPEKKVKGRRMKGGQDAQATAVVDADLGVFAADEFKD